MLHVMQEEKLSDVKNEWRCPICKRLLGFIIGGKTLEIISSNKQTILVKANEKKVFCKCGCEILVDKKIFKIMFPQS